MFIRQFIFYLQTEVQNFLHTLHKTEGTATDISLPMTLAVTNVICSILMSVRFEENDSRFLRFMELIEEGFKLCTATGASNFIPCLRNLPRLQALNQKIRTVSFIYIDYIYFGMMACIFA